MKEWGALAFLDVLRPSVGLHVDAALFATYSLEPRILVACLLALSGVDEDTGKASKVELAQAIERLRGRVRVVAQAGRMTVPRRSNSVLMLLDQFVRFADFDEQTHSWHPKAAVVRFLADDSGVAEWRLWIGSRNMTATTDWDSGLVLVGQVGGAGHAIPGIDDLVTELAQRAQFDGFFARVRAEVPGLRWRLPAGVQGIDEIRLFSETGERLPKHPERLESLLVVSPFLDGAVVGTLGRWGANAQRTLVSTRPELTRLSKLKGNPLAGFHQLVAFDVPAEDSAPEDAEDVDTETDELTEARSLHAKLVLAAHGGRHTLWLGSANATRRGWHSNGEVIARLTIDQETADGLGAFALDGTPQSLAELAAAAPPDPDQDQELEAAQQQVAVRLAATLRVQDEGLWLAAETPPHPDNLEVGLEVALLGAAHVSWPRGQLRILLPAAPAGQLTELLEVRLTLADATRSWLHRVLLDPPAGVDRDRQVLSAYLDPRSYLQWIRSLLDDNAAGDGGGAWDDVAPRHDRLSPRTGRSVLWWAPTLEDILRAYSRDPKADRLRQVDDVVQQFAAYVAAHPDNAASPEDLEELRSFQRVWRLARRELLRGKA